MNWNSGLMFRSQNGTAQLHISDRGLKVWTNLEVATSMTANQLTVSGSKNRAMDTDDFGKVLLSAYETPTPMFGDVGEGTVAEDGLCYIELDPILAEVINTASYQVFLQKYGPGDVYVSERHPTYFVVTGTPRLSFAWELKGKQVDLDQRRFLSQDVDMADQEIHEPDYTDFSHIDHDYAMEAASYLREIQEDRLALGYRKYTKDNSTVGAVCMFYEMQNSATFYHKNLFFNVTVVSDDQAFLGRTALPF